MSEFSSDDLSGTPEIVIGKNAELLELEKSFEALFGQRDNIYLPGREIRHTLLYRGICDLHDVMRQSAELQVREAMCARIVSRTFCIARAADNVSIAEGMAMKYPIIGCSYCGGMPCICPEDREAFKPANPAEEQIHWALRDWQEHLTRMYGEKNEQRGIYYVMTRLGLEYGELISLEKDIPHLSIEEAKHRYALELADTLAWTIATASILGVDLQKAVEDRYGHGCIRCHQVPCACPPHSFEQLTARPIPEP